MMELKYHHFVTVAAVVLLIILYKTNSLINVCHHLFNTLGISSQSLFAYKLYGMTKLISNKM